MAAKTRIIVKGIPQTQNVLRQISPELAKSLNREFMKAGRIIATGARAITPVRTGQSKRMIRVYLGGNKIRRSSAKLRAADSARRASGRFVPPGGNRGSERLAGLRVIQGALGGSIIEFANKAKTKQGATLVRNLTAKYGTSGRFMWETYDRNRAVVDGAVKKATRDVEAKLASMEAKF